MMNIPQWNTSKARMVREELLRRVVNSPRRREEYVEAVPDPGRRGRFQPAVAFIVTAALVVPVSILAILHPARSAGGESHSDVLSVSTADRMPAPSSHVVATEGRLEAKRLGTHVCFWLKPTTATTATLGSLLVFRSGYAARSSLALLGPAGDVVAKPGDTISIVTPSSYTSGLLGSMGGCPVGTGEVPVLQLRRGPAEAR